MSDVEDDHLPKIAPDGRRLQWLRSWSVWAVILLVIWNLLVLEPRRERGLYDYGVQSFLIYAFAGFFTYLGFLALVQHLEMEPSLRTLNPLPPLRTGLVTLFRFLPTNFDFWYIFELDVRSLALMRVLFGLTAIGDILVSRIPSFSDFYVRETGFPPWSSYGDEELFLGGNGSAARLLLTLNLLLATCVLVGYRTRLSLFLFVWAHFILFTRVRTWNRADDCWANVALLLLFLPTSDVFSVDAALREARPAARPAPRHRLTPATVALFAYMIVLYGGSGAYKHGSWFDGTALYFTLKNKGLAGELGRWFGEATPFIFQYGMNFVVLYWEKLGCLLFFSIWRRDWCLYAGVFGFFCMHLGFRIMLPLVQGFFWFPLAPLAAMLPSHFWDILLRRAPEKTAPAYQVRVRERRLGVVANLLHLASFYNKNWSISHVVLTKQTRRESPNTVDRLIEIDTPEVRNCRHY